MAAGLQQYRNYIDLLLFFLLLMKYLFSKWKPNMLIHMVFVAVTSRRSYIIRLSEFFMYPNQFLVALVHRGSDNHRS